MEVYDDSIIEGSSGYDSQMSMHAKKYLPSQLGSRFTSNSEVDFGSSATPTSTGTHTTSKRPSTALSTRSGTASGRKSRATTASSIFGFTDLQNVICAVSEARGVTPSVGVAFINVSIGEVTLSQICDNQSYVKTIHKIQMMSPNRIVCMATTCPPYRPSTLYSLIKEHVSESQIDAFDRSSWSEIDGLDYIQDLALEGDVEPLKVALNGKYYAITALAAVGISGLINLTDTC
jgi:DNA mismatch repair protein MSH4